MKHYFCDHCKIPGHSIQRCFKIHGHPPGHRLHNKGRKIAATVQADAEAGYPENVLQQTSLINQAGLNSAPVPGLTARQYN